jgi:UDP-glucose 4-epimerase
LVTGGAGFIGVNLVRTLSSCGYELTILDNFSVGRGEYLEGLPIRIIEDDILNFETTKAAVAGQDAVIHLAAKTGVPGSIAEPRRDCQVNVIGTLNLLEACRVNPQPPRFIFASSNAPLGRQTPPASEDKAPLPVSPYGASKLAGEAYCLAYYGSWRVPIIALRFGNVYGPFSAHKGSVVAKFMKEITAGHCLQIDGDGQQTRDFIYVADLCRAIRLALESRVSGEIFQIATGVETSIKTLAELIEQIAGKHVEVRHGLAREGDVRRNYSAISKARNLLHWEPGTNLMQGLIKTMSWFSDSFVAVPKTSELVVFSAAGKH